MKVFISYSTKDSFPAKICSELERLGTECWIAPRDIPRGTPYAKAIMKALSEADIILVFVSSNSLYSEDVLNEIDNAHGMHKTIIPIFIENIELNSEFSYYLKRKQWIRCYGNLKYCIDELSSSLNLMGGETNTTTLQPPFSIDYFFDKINNPKSKSKFDDFMMPIEDVISITGRGTVVTGKVECGTVKVGDELIINGAENSLKSVVVAIEMFRKLVDSAEIGDNCGLLLRGINPNDVARGMILSQRIIKSTKEFSAVIYLFKRDECKENIDTLLTTNSSITIYNRTSDRIATVHMVEHSITNGFYGTVHFRVSSKICLENDDVVILTHNKITVGIGLVFGL